MCCCEKWACTVFVTERQRCDLFRRYQSQPVPLVSVDEVNQWVENATSGHIPDFLDSIPHDVVLMLINAVYFKGDSFHRKPACGWETGFVLLSSSRCSGPVTQDISSLLVSRCISSLVDQLPLAPLKTQGSSSWATIQDPDVFRTTNKALFRESLSAAGPETFNLTFKRRRRWAAGCYGGDKLLLLSVWQVNGGLDLTPKWPQRESSIWTARTRCQWTWWSLLSILSASSMIQSWKHK